MAARASRRAWWVFAAAGGAYFMAIMHCTALGVAGVDALGRFGIGATGLAAVDDTDRRLRRPADARRAAAG